MVPSKEVLLLLNLLILKVVTYHFEMTKLIERVFSLNDSQTVFFIGRSEDHEDFVSEFSKTHSSIPVMIMTDLTIKSNVLYSGILVVGCLDNEDQDNLSEFIECLEVRKYIIVSMENLDELKRWFSFFAKKGFKRIYGISQSDGISYFYSPYIRNRIQQLSDDTGLPNVLTYLNGFTVRSNMINTFPLTFYYKTKEGEEQIGGLSGQIFTNFLRKHSATYEVIPLQNISSLDYMEILRATEANKLDLSVNVLSLVDPLANHGVVGEFSCFSGKLEVYKIMVAINGFVEPDEYFLKPFDGVVWLCIGLTLFYITAVDIIWKLCTKSQIDVWHSFSQIFLNMLNVSLERPITTAYRLHTQVSLFAFIIGNIYVIFFTSYLTAYIPIKQYDSVQDLVEDNVSVMIANSKFEWLSDKVEYNPGLKDILLPVDYDTLYSHVLPMNNEIKAYILNSDEADIFLDFHARFAEPRFRIASGGVFPKYFLIFFMPKHSPYKEILDHFILQIRETGLMNKWHSDLHLEFNASEFRKYLGGNAFGKYVDNNAGSAYEVFKPLKLVHFVFVWKLLGIGWTLATVAFCGEYLWHFLSKSRIN